jgi:hypothetical protein
MSRVASAEWVQLFVIDLFRLLRSRGQLGILAKLVQQNSQIQKFLQDFQQLVGI